jgi:hypothetical protein
MRGEQPDAGRDVGIEERELRLEPCFAWGAHVAPGLRPRMQTIESAKRVSSAVRA